MTDFEPGNIYACEIPGHPVRLLFDCQALIVHPGSRRTLGTGFTQYEGSGFWRDVPVNYRYSPKWSLYKENESERPTTGN